MTITDFRPYYEPFKGKFYMYGHYQILERYHQGQVIGYTVKHGRELVAIARDFTQAFEICKAHQEKGRELRGWYDVNV